jgi:hypothetical protein
MSTFLAARRLGAAWILAVAGSVTPGVASADGSATDPVLAQTLFDEGRRLMAQGRFAEACPKFAESQRLDPGGGTLLNLAVCHESEGRTATAWAELHEAQSQAIADRRPERQARAREHLAAIEARLSRLTISKAADAGPVSITLDGAPLADAALGVATPRDPGEHVVTASAPDKKPWTATVTLGATADSQNVVVPALEDPAPAATPPTPAAPEPVAASAEAPSPSVPGQRQRILGEAVGGAGAAALLAGAVFGGLTLSEKGASDAQCGARIGAPAGLCNAQGVADHGTASTDATLSTVLFIAGGAAAAAGVALFVTAPRSGAPASQVGAGPGWLWWRGSF